MVLCAAVATRWQYSPALTLPQPASFLAPPQLPPALRRADPTKDAEDQNESDPTCALQQELLKLTGVVNPEDPCRACPSSPLHCRPSVLQCWDLQTPQQSNQDPLQSGLTSRPTACASRPEPRGSKGNEKNNPHTLLLGWAAENDARYRVSLDSALKGAWASRGPGSAVAGGT